MRRESDAAVVNLALDGQLISWLVEWRRRTHPPVGYPEITARVNAALEDKAARLGVEAPTPYDQSSLYRWGRQLGIEDEEYVE